MDQATSTLIGAFIGASAGIAGGVGLEAFKRRRDRQGVAMALAGAIEAELWAIETRGHVAFFRDLLRTYEAGQTRTLYGFTPEGNGRNVIADAYIDRFGILGGNLPADVIIFFQTMWSISTDLRRIVDGKFGEDPKVLARVVRQDLAIFDKLDPLGRELARRLRHSTRPWWRFWARLPTQPSPARPAPSPASPSQTPGP